MNNFESLTSSLKGRGSNYWCVLAIFAALVARFWKTIFLAKPISLLFLISIWDSLFYKIRTGQSVDIDASLIELHMPYRFFVAEYWHHAVPLWNQFSAFGMPLLADPQAFVLSPLLALFHFLPSVYTWNFTLIIELAIGAFSTYFLCRELELDYMSSLVGSFLFTLCPWIQWQLELLGNGNCLTPFVFLFFARAAKRKSLWYTVMAGIAAAIDVLAAHPEVSCMSILFACLLMCLVNYFQDRDQFNLLNVIGRICLAGIIAFGLSSPLLFPFAEYIHNGQTYKFDAAAPANISLRSLLASYFCLFFSTNSIYLGPLSTFGFIALICFPKETNRYFFPVVICFLTSVLAVTRLFPLDALFRLPFLNTVQACYCIPEYILLLVLVSSFGVNRLRSNIADLSQTRKVLAGLLVLAVILIPLVVRSGFFNDYVYHFDPLLESSKFDFKLWLFNAICSALMFVTLCSTFHRKLSYRAVAYVCVLGLGAANLLVLSANCLPVRPFFQYPRALPLNIVKDNGARYLSIGDHLLRSNTNVLYDLPTLKVVNPIFPAGFIPFLKACGAQIDDCAQTFPATVKRLLDLTSTKTILSEQPLLDEESITRKSKSGETNSQTSELLEFGKMLAISEIQLFEDEKQGAIFCRLIAKPLFPPRAASYHIYCNIRDEKGTSVCFIEPHGICGLYDRQPMTFSAFLPKDVKHWSISLGVISDSNSARISPSLVGKKFGVNRNDESVLVATSEQKDAVVKINNERFEPLDRYGSSIVAYRNKTALDRYFFVKRTEWSTNKADALEFLKSHPNELAEVAVLEGSQKKQFEDLLVKIGDSTHRAEFNQSGHIANLDSKDASHFEHSPTLNLEVDNPKPALLVVSDMYYPGWHALLDGKDWPIFRADSIFRALLLPSGKHNVRFEYMPSSFTVGLLVFIMTVVGLIISRFGNFRRRTAKISDLVNLEDDLKTASHLK